MERRKWGREGRGRHENERRRKRKKEGRGRGRRKGGGKREAANTPLAALPWGPDKLCIHTLPVTSADD